MADPATAKSTAGCREVLRDESRRSSFPADATLIESVDMLLLCLEVSRLLILSSRTMAIQFPYTMQKEKQRPDSRVTAGVLACCQKDSHRHTARALFRIKGQPQKHLIWTVYLRIYLEKPDSRSSQANGR